MFHASCLNRALRVKNPICLHEVDQGDCDSPNIHEIVADVLRSQEFKMAISVIVNEATEDLLAELKELRTEVRNLRDSNIELIRFITKKDEFATSDNSESKKSNLKTLTKITNNPSVIGQHVLGKQIQLSSQNVLADQENQDNSRPDNPVTANKDNSRKVQATRIIKTAVENNNTISDVPKDIPWKEVSYKRDRKKKQIDNISTTIEDRSKGLLIGTAKRAWLYVGRISNKNATENTVVNCLKEEYPDEDFIVEKLHTVGNNSAFKIGVPLLTMCKSVSTLLLASRCMC
ncbi:hypothetical protein Zmor_021749 [Zophobas morio]|uniref:Uncharacterized protein n=1 Tax=Zophobas morio TaxID=2755281 RepID=A0AA38I359_9CUCU|nr:hypothetical protein Zmor_021749 [Zophobas morio]